MKKKSEQHREWAEAQSASHSKDGAAGFCVRDRGEVANGRAAAPRPGAS